MHLFALPTIAFTVCSSLTYTRIRITLLSLSDFIPLSSSNTTIYSLSSEKAFSHDLVELDITEIVELKFDKLDLDGLELESAKQISLVKITVAEVNYLRSLNALSLIEVTEFQRDTEANLE